MEAWSAQCSRMLVEVLVVLCRLACICKSADREMEADRMKDKFRQIARDQAHCLLMQCQWSLAQMLRLI